MLAIAFVQHRRLRDLRALFLQLVIVRFFFVLLQPRVSLLPPSSEFLFVLRTIERYCNRFAVLAGARLIECEDAAQAAEILNFDQQKDLTDYALF